jgi:hypothetical protein
LSEEQQTLLKINWCSKILNGGDLLEKKFRSDFEAND